MTEQDVRLRLLLVLGTVVLLLVLLAAFPTHSSGALSMAFGRPRHSSGCSVCIAVLGALALWAPFLLT